MFCQHTSSTQNPRVKEVRAQSLALSGRLEKKSLLHRCCCCLLKHICRLVLSQLFFSFLFCFFGIGDRPIHCLTSTNLAKNNNKNKSCHFTYCACFQSMGSRSSAICGTATPYWNLKSRLRKRNSGEDRVVVLIVEICSPRLRNKGETT